MSALRPVRLAVTVSVISLAAAGAIAGASPAIAQSTRSAPGDTSFATNGELLGVAAAAANSAWTVGYSGSFESPKTLIAHWNGKSWARVTTRARRASAR